MLKRTSLALLAGASFLGLSFDRALALDAASPPDPAVIYANHPQQTAPVRAAYAQPSNLGGGFIEFLFGDRPAQDPRYQQPTYRRPVDQQPAYGVPAQPQAGSQPFYPRQEQAYNPAQRQFDPRYEKQEVAYDGKEAAGTIVIDTPDKFLFLVEGDGKALRYGIGVGRPGFTWSGVKTITAKREWPDWTPPSEMLARRPDLPRYMAGGPENPLGARAMYLGSTLYRIHGSNEPWTIGTNVSSGCIRMRNEDVIDLYDRVKVGTKVVVL